MKHEATVQTYRSWDGVELFYRAWHPTTPSSRAIVIFHRGHEHSGRMQDLVNDLQLVEFHIFAWDARGHGQSPGERGYAESLSVMIKDTEAFVQHIKSQYKIPLENMAVVAHSVGAVIASAWVHDFAPALRALVLATPAFRMKLYIPFAIPALRFKQKLIGRGYVKSYVHANMLTHDAKQVKAYQNDRHIFRQIADHVLLDLHDVSTRIISDAGAIHVPTLILSAGSDWVVRLGAQRKFFERLSSSSKRMAVLPKFYHAVFHEKDRHIAIAKTREFILESFSQPQVPLSLLNADKVGYTKNEYDRLKKRSCHTKWLLTKVVMKTLGRMSRGISLGWQVGFDSGVMLDYIYNNRPQGFTLLGSWLDRAYINSIGWQGIRQRKVNLEGILRTTIESVHRANRPVHLLDVASGPGRYVLETIKQLQHIPISATLRDFSLNNIEAGNHLARELNVVDVTFERGNAFDRADLQALQPRPTIAIVSGLYELFPENEGVLASLAGLAELLEEGSYLIYTNQPWHPQVEFIARVLTNRDGRPWIMRRRTQAEMNQMVEQAGFERIQTEVDPWGIFTVSLAVRRETRGTPDAIGLNSITELCG